MNGNKARVVTEQEKKEWAKVDAELAKKGIRMIPDPTGQRAVKWTCKTCLTVFLASFLELEAGEAGCPTCFEAKG
jgi:hypothetical protein